MITRLPSSSSSDNAGSSAPARMANPAQPASPNQAPNIVIPGKFKMLPVPPAMTQTIVSATGGGALAKTAIFGNEGVFNSTPTDNGSGADTITNTYGDGWSGKGYNQLFNSGEGLDCYGFTLEYVTTGTGAQNPGGLNTANPTLLIANLVGTNQIPRGYVLSAGARNTQYLPGTMTVDTQFTLNCLAQLSYGVPVGNTVTLTIFTQPLN